MRIIKERVTRCDVITFYVEYDRRKKGHSAIENLRTWPWDDPKAIDKQLQNNKLKPGVLSAYRIWQLVQLDFIDIMSCAIVNRIFKAKWYIEDGSGRALALLQRMLIHQELWHTAWAYIGTIPDEDSDFIQKHPDLLGC